MKINRCALLLVACFLVALAPAAESPASPSAAPADAGFKIHRTAPIPFPVVLLRDGITHGEARVLLDIDADGRLVDTLIASYTHEPFAASALDAIKQWRFAPARLNGETVGVVVDCLITFSVDGVLFHQRVGLPVFEKRDALAPKLAYQAHALPALDRIPTPQHVEPPVYLPEWAAQGMRGQVVVNFYIDEQGVVRMPSGVSSPYPLLNAAATAALRKWRFAPPRRQGRPVLAHCEQVFNFEPPAAAPPADRAP